MLPDRPSSRPALPAAVSTLVAAVVHGEPVDAEVVAAHRYALYLSVRGSVLPVVTSDAVPLPTAVRLGVASGALASRANPGHDRSTPWGVAAGDVVQVGAGRVALPGLDVVAARTWRPARVRTADPRRVGCSGGRRGSHLSSQLEMGGWGGCETAHGSGWLADGIRAACSTSRDACGSGCRDDHFRTHGEVGAAVAALVGRGPGLTPSGDDALAGALLVAHALGAGEALSDAVRARLAATTAVSAALLAAAAEGYAAHPVVALVDAAVAADPDAVRRALPAVLAIGHTSGADTVTGIRAALTTLRAGAGCSDGRQGSHLSTQLEEPTGRSAA
jgi:hypothetical protein